MVTEQGFSQVKEVDYSKTYAPVVRYATIRHLLALAAQLNLMVYLMDVVTAYLQGDMDGEEMYMEQLEGFRNEAVPRKVCRLKKALCDLK